MPTRAWLLASLLPCTFIVVLSEIRYEPPLLTGVPAAFELAPLEGAPACDYKADPNLALCDPPNRPRTEEAVAMGFAAIPNGMCCDVVRSLVS